MRTTNRTRAMEAMVKLTRAGGVFDYGPDRSRLLLRVMRMLPQGRPVSADQLEQIIAEIGLPRDDAHEFLGQVAERGPDEEIAGILGLSLSETPHRFTASGTRLFTWCAADTLFLPALLGQPASIESASPVSGATIRLTVSPQRVEAVDPASAVVSMVVVDPDAADTSSVEAIWGTFCHHIFFFATRQEAEAWAAGRDNRGAIEIVSVDEAFELGQLVSSTLLTEAGER
jgi:alkylmercury lyase